MTEGLRLIEEGILGDALTACRRVLVVTRNLS
jgi:hypothetical protein